MDSVFEIAGILPLTPENSEIVEEGDFPVLYLLDDKGKKERLGLIEIKRAFPFEQDWEFLVLSDEEGKDWRLYPESEGPKRRRTGIDPQRAEPSVLYAGH